MLSHKIGGMCGVGGVGDWVGVSDWGWGGLNFIKEIPLKTNPTKVVKKFQNLKIWLKFAPDNRQVWSQFSKNRPNYGDFDFLLGNPPTCSEY